MSVLEIENNHQCNKAISKCFKQKLLQFNQLENRIKNVYKESQECYKILRSIHKGILHTKLVTTRITKKISSLKNIS